MGMISKKAGGTTALGFALGAAMMMAQPADAAVFNFEKLADTNEGAWNERGLSGDTGKTTEGAWAGTNTDGNYIWRVDGIGVAASAGGIPASEAYLDKISSSKFGGLGVCSTGFNSGTNNGTNLAGECQTSSDDNVSSASGVAEVLTLTFTGAVSITGATFRDKDHNLYNDTTNTGDFEYQVNGVGGFQTAGFAGFSLSGLGTTINSISLRYKSPDQFYLSTLTAVPLPAGVLLLGSALGGLGLMKRRRKAA